MMHANLSRESGVLVLRPDGRLLAGDFAGLAALVDPYIEERGELRGLLVEAPSFPGWEDFGALVSHLRFVRDHHRKVRRIAVVTDSGFLTAAPRLASHFVAAEIKTFAAGERDAAVAWLEGG